VETICSLSGPLTSLPPGRHQTRRPPVALQRRFVWVRSGPHYACSLFDGGDLWLALQPGRPAAAAGAAAAAGGEERAAAAAAVAAGAEGLGDPRVQETAEGAGWEAQGEAGAGPVAGQEEGRCGWAGLGWVGLEL
jgi:hypothetical protein